ncbi:hypothetical protein HW130_25850 [Streptomyces sp. PKU-EA00015]|uniref:DUF5819 family protein n=1 Tax=Streptomyces sp. PKU-EA00015 TaxID=2748326 RepID=UPI0015A4764B|nr:DUF5819 family protein [Streptomyces sp. PKU-EA00015]NWF29637.1 hypothetical protein [Streptomyces sp. PKU-EA00015]
MGLLVSGVLLFHFGMTALHNSPFNPVRERYDEQIHAYMSPYFQQDWHLFAPNPIADDAGWLVRAQKREPDGSVTTTDWVDVTSPHIAKLHRQRFWPSRVERLAPSVRQQLESWRDPQLDKLRLENSPADAGKSADRGDPTDARELDPPLTPGELIGRDNTLLYIRALASDEATALWGERISAVQVRVVTNEYPRFSERKVRSNKGKIEYYDLAWMKPLKVAR